MALVLGKFCFFKGAPSAFSCRTHCPHPFGRETAPEIRILREVSVLPTYAATTKSVLLVSAQSDFIRSVEGLLPAAGFLHHSLVTSAEEAGRKLKDCPYDLVICNAPDSPAALLPFLKEVAEDTFSGVLLFVKEEFYDLAAEKTAGEGIFVLPRPVGAQEIRQALRLLFALSERTLKLRKRAASLEEKMDEIRLVNRAKWILISRLSMTEEDAHRYIEKRAMNQCVSKKEIALDLIKTYE